jgi:hypothetical protein
MIRIAKCYCFAYAVFGDLMQSRSTVAIAVAVAIAVTISCSDRYVKKCQITRVLACCRRWIYCESCLVGKSNKYRVPTSFRRA